MSVSNNDQWGREGYWEGFVDYMQKRYPIYQHRTPSQEPYQIVPPSWGNKIRIAAGVNKRPENLIRVDLTLNSGSLELTKEWFRVVAFEREIIERDISPRGGGEWDWAEGPGKKESYIAIRRSASVEWEEWEDQYAWLAENVDAFHKVFGPRADKLAKVVRETGSARRTSVVQTIAPETRVVTSEQPRFNRADPTVLSEIASYGRQYRSKHLSGYDTQLLLRDWWSALDFFFARIYYQGRRDPISDKVRAAAIEVCLPLFTGKTGRENFNLLLAAQWQPLEDELRKKIGKGYVGKGGDIRMTLSALNFIGHIPDLNIVAYSVARIRSGQIESHYTELQHSLNHKGEGIYQVGPKVTSFYLRDLVSLYDLDDQINREFAQLLQPVDVHVRKVACLMGLVDDSADDGNIRRAIVETCLENDLPPLLFNQGAWFLSFNYPEKLLALTATKSMIG